MNRSIVIRVDEQHDKHQFGAIVGRVTNVIKGAQFTMNGTLYKVSPNYGKNTLNGKLLLILSSLQYIYVIYILYG